MTDEATAHYRETKAMMEPSAQIGTAERIQILTLANAIVIEKKFGLFRLVDIVAAYESYAATGTWPAGFVEQFKALIEKQQHDRLAFPYKGPGVPKP